nr:ATP/GTP-binding protein [Streptomyces sp. alain-838]
MTKGLLLAVFCVGLVAQFVKPVGDALQGKTYIGGALLSIVGYVLYAEVLRLNTAHDAQREGARHLHDTVRQLSEEVRELTARLRPQSGEDVSADRLMEECAQALRRGGEIELWGLCFTGETFVEPLRRVLEDLPPDPSRSVSVRILVPDFTRPIEGSRPRAGGGRQAGGRPGIPPVPGREDRRVRARAADDARQDGPQGPGRADRRVPHGAHVALPQAVRRRRRGGVRGDLRQARLRPDEYRSPGTAPSGPGTEGDQLLDLIGHGSLLTRWSRYDGELAREVVARRRAFFGTLWDAACPLSRGPHAAGGA